MKKFISIATYNEKENIDKLIRQIFRIGLDDLFVVVTDDNSPDGTAQVVEKLQAEYKNLNLIRRSGKLGYGSAHVAGFKLALSQGADLLISMDADFSHDPKYLPEMIEAIESGHDVAIGSRRIPGGEVVGWNWWRKFCSRGAMTISKILLGITVSDLTSGYRAYRREVFEKIDLATIHSEGYSFLEELIYLIEKNNFTVKDIPIVFVDRKFGRSKLSKKEIVNFFITIFKIRFRKKI